MQDQQRSTLVAIMAGIIGLLLGAGFQYVNTRDDMRALEETRAALSFQQIEATLGAATIEAQRGSYEIARQLASQFFGDLQTHVTSAPPDRQAPFQELLTQRDAMITALSRGDPQSGPLLAQMFVRYRIAMGEPVGPEGTQHSPPLSPPAQPLPADTVPSAGGQP
jgi:hypothetical protein